MLHSQPRRSPRRRFPWQNLPCTEREGTQAVWGVQDETVSVRGVGWAGERMKKGRSVLVLILLGIIALVLIILGSAYSVLLDAISNYFQPYLITFTESAKNVHPLLILFGLLIFVSVLIGTWNNFQKRLEAATKNQQDEFRSNHPVEHRYLTWIIDNLSSEQATFVKPKVSLLTPINYKKSGRKKLKIGTVIQNAFRLATGFDNLVESEMIHDGYGIIIEGDPGLGKTACLRRQILNRAKKIVTGEENLPRIPVYIVISDYRGDVPFLEFFKNRLDRSFRYSTFLSQDIDRFLAQGRLLIFLDDDVIEGQDSQKRFEGIISFTEKHKDNFFVIASRPNSWLRKFGFTHYRLNPFSGRDAWRLLGKILDKSQLRQAKNIIEHIPGAYFWLTTNPNMLWVLARTVQWSEKTPKNRTELVANFIDTALKAEANKRGEEIDINNLRSFLESAAFHSLENTEFEIPAYLFEEDPRLEINGLIMQIFVGAGVLGKTEDGHAIFFSQAIIRDYFAGSHIRKEWKMHGKLAFLEWSSKWVNPISFASGMLDGDEGEKLLRQIKLMYGFIDNSVFIGEMIAYSNIDRETQFVVETVEQINKELNSLHGSRLQIVRILSQLYNKETRDILDGLFFESHKNLSWLSWLSQANDTLQVREQIISALKLAGVRVSFAYWAVFILTWIGVKAWRILSIPIKIDFFLYPLFVALVELLLTYIWIPLSIFVIYWIIKQGVTETSISTLSQLIRNITHQYPILIFIGVLVLAEIAYGKVSFFIIQRKSQAQLGIYLNKLRASHKLNPWSILVAQFALQRYGVLVRESNPDEVVAFLASIATDDRFPVRFLCQAIKELALTRDPRAADAIVEILSMIDFNDSQSSFYIAWTCTVALGFLDTEKSIDRLKKIIEEPIRKIRNIALDSLALLGSEDAAKEILRAIDFETKTGQHALNSYLIIEAHLMNCVPVTDALLDFKRPDKYFYHWKDWIEDFQRGMHVQYYKVVSECVNNGRMKEWLSQKIENTNETEIKDKLRRIIETFE